MKTITLFLTFVLMGIVETFATNPKQMMVMKIETDDLIEAEQVIEILDKHNIAFDSISVVNWKNFSYKPEVYFRMAHTGKRLLIHYKVREKDVRAAVEVDNGRVWDDSCVEFFVSPDRNRNFYNIETNCIGKLVFRHNDYNGKIEFANQWVFDVVKRWSSLGSKSFGERLGETDWEMTLVIPVETFFKHRILTFDKRIMTCNLFKCGGRQRTPHFLTWSPITSIKPNFHTPEFFGTVIFE